MTLPDQAHNSTVRRRVYKRKAISEDAKPLAELAPHKLIDTLVDHMQLKGDADLCRLLGVLPPYISKIRHRKLPVAAGMLLRMHEESEISIRELKVLREASK